MTPEAARTAALRAIGGIEQRKEQMRDARRVSVIENLLRDLRLAFRQLRKQPGFTFTAIVSLALGIGANTAIFQLLNALSLRSLPVRAPHELVEMRLTGDGRAGRHTGRNRQISLPQYQELAQRQQAFSAMLAFGDTRFNLSPTGRGPLRRRSVGVRQFLRHCSVWRRRWAADRAVRRSCPDAGPGVAVISHALWQSQFGGRADIVGQTVPGLGTPVPIIGVTPPGFFGVEVGRQFGVAMPNCASGNRGAITGGWPRSAG